MSSKKSTQKDKRMNKEKSGVAVMDVKFKIGKKSKVNVAFKEGYDMGYRHAMKEDVNILKELQKKIKELANE